MRQKLQQVASWVGARPWAITGVALVAIVVLKWPAHALPPVWDEACSIFPAALHLARHGFDLFALASQPGYAAGGANVHATTLVTWYTAAVLWLTNGGDTAWFILHGVQWLLGAMLLATLFQFVRQVTSPRLAAVIVVLTLCQPMVRAQLGYMYLEIPMLAFTCAAFAAYCQGRQVLAAVLITLAVWSKETGVISAGALILAAMVERQPWRQALGRTAGLAVGPLSVLAGALLLAPGGPPHQLNWLASIKLTALMVGSTYVPYVPDAFLLAFAGLVLAAALIAGFTRALREADAPPPARAAARCRFICAAIVLLFAGFHFIVVPRHSDYFAFLPRYLVHVMPFLFVLIVLAGQRLVAERVWVAVGVGAIALFLVNGHGRLYGYQQVPFDNCFGLAERSEEYVDAFTVQRDGVRAMAALPPDIPVFYALPEQYLLRDPALGYVSRARPNTYCVFNQVPPELLNLAGLPPEFYLFYFYPWLGGERILQLAEDATRTQGYRRETVARFRQGRYYSVLLRVSRLPQAPLAR